ncbi:MAG: CPBP family intramembrane glutamic endopeptidase, partial [Bryobacteraceae bacterium]
MASISIPPEAPAGDDRFRPVAGTLNTLGLIALLALLAYLGLISAGKAGGQGLGNHALLYVPTLIAEWLLFLYVWLGIRARRVSLRELIGPRWTSVQQISVNILVAAAFWLGSALVNVVTGYLLRTGNMTERLKFMAPRGAGEMATWVLLSITAGICEETIFRGYLQRQFIAWTRNSAFGVALSAILFGAGHIYQGWRQATVIGIYGAMFGTLAVWRKDLRPGMMAHAFQ